MFSGSGRQAADGAAGDNYPLAQSPLTGEAPRWLRRLPSLPRAGVLRRFPTGAPASGGQPSQAREADHAGFAELDCLHGVLAPQVLQGAAQRSRELGIGADRVLIARGIIGEDAYLQHLARHIGASIETFAGLGRSDCPLPDAKLADAARHGLLPLRRQDELHWVIAPRCVTARYLSRPGMQRNRAGRIHLASSSAFDQFLMQQCGGVLANVAGEGLRSRWPALSAGPTQGRGRFRAMSVVVLSLLLLAAASLLTSIPVAAAGSILAVWFLAFAALRLAASLMPGSPPASSPRLADDELPLYTIVVALYREASSVAPLLQALNSLDYPHEKLDIKIVVEPNDLETRAAIARFCASAGTMLPLQVIVAPRTGPQTKPKALNCALPFARGTFIAVFDAEDRPEPQQLRAALAAFRTHSPNVACVQASLCIHNTRDGWLARMFGVEYAGQFDAFLPGLARFGMPLPLGGTSNHFRTDVLRAVGGWDPYNVTEDADLGMRLSRFGYRAVTFASTTFEEAPISFGAWLRQRTRWMKGWLQTWNVHMRAPRRFWRESGWSGWLALNLMVGGSVLTALVHPLLLLGLAAYFVAPRTDGAVFAAPSGVLLPLHAVAITAGYIATVIVGLTGLKRRRRIRDGWVLILTPLYWLCLSLAAWRALLQLLTDPYRWEKTEHGLTGDAGPVVPLPIRPPHESEARAAQRESPAFLRSRRIQR